MIQPDALKKNEPLRWSPGTGTGFSLRKAPTQIRKSKVPQTR